MITRSRRVQEEVVGLTYSMAVPTRVASIRNRAEREPKHRSTMCRDLLSEWLVRPMMRREVREVRPRAAMWAIVSGVCGRPQIEQKMKVSSPSVPAAC
jgi:hypothetical protein